MKNIIRITIAVIILVLMFQSSSFGKDVSIKRAKKYTANIPAEVIKKTPLPKGYHEGLYFDGTNIWVNNGKDGKTWVVDPVTGEVVSDISPVGPFTEAIAPAGDGTYWLTDWKDKKLYRVKIEDGKMISEYDVSLDPAHPAGLAWIGDYVYVISWTRGFGTKYYLHEFDAHGNELRKMQIKRIHEPAHLAWDGKNLWITSWYTRNVYRLDLATLEITGSFKSPSPDTTGIAWDGESFWITGTHTGLYKVKVGDK